MRESVGTKISVLFCSEGPARSCYNRQSGVGEDFLVRWRFTQPDMGELPTVGAGVCSISVDVRVRERTQLHFCLCLGAVHILRQPK